ncbi:MAG TPA: cystathionine gamma-synthase [Acidimicrobiales bacterium]|nr:cystathionine gamma-synthase [Acidimicrobiales bacterium]
MSSLSPSSPSSPSSPEGADRAEGPGRPEGSGRRGSGFGFETRAIHAGQDPDPTTGAVIPPVSVSTTFAQSAVAQHHGWDYSRSGNPTRDALEACIASLEGAAYGLAFASGLAAEDAVLRLLRPGDHLIIPDDAYGGTWRLIDKIYRPIGIEHTAVAIGDPSAIAAAWRPTTRLVWTETPTNPELGIVDIAALADVVHERGGRLVIDNTFATPYLQQPLSLGADLVAHSATKYLGGHSDVVGGWIGTNDPDLAEQLAFHQHSIGAVPGPFDCYLVMRGVKTLAVRMDRHCSNAERVVDLLIGHPAVTRVHYPGLPSHPGHDIAARQMRGFGGMVSFVLAGGEDAALKVAGSTSLWTLAESLGAVESLIEHPARMTHASVASSPLAVDPGLLRLSVGLETIDDLLADLAAALDRVA